jgi:hypothetical protein
VPSAENLHRSGAGHSWICTSDDHGATWQKRETYNFSMSRPFVAGGRIYVIGHFGDLTIMRSDDDGVSWGEPVRLTDGMLWHQSACNVWHANGCVYLVMERRVSFETAVWGVGELAPVLMRAPVDADLTQRESWTFASELSFRDALPGAEAYPEIDYFGIPFFHAPDPSGVQPAPGRTCAPIGWLETNVVQIVDPDHCWHDPTGRTMHLFARAHTGGTGYAALVKVVERGETAGSGPMETMLERAPSGKRFLFVPLPGGQMRFHLLYDDQTSRYWLLSTQATDSMSRAETLGQDRYGLPNNERQRLVLHFSLNMVDWCFAGVVAAGSSERASRHYASMVIDGDDLHVGSRSGDDGSRSAHDGNMVTLHTVRRFRDLVY